MPLALGRGPATSHGGERECPDPFHPRPFRACHTQASFDLTVTRKDFVHALVAYFDVTFGDGHKPIGFSTGPRSRATHWKQTVFYLRDTLIVHAGDHVTGEVRCAPNAKNPRDLEIGIQYACKARDGAWSGEQSYKMR